MQEQPPENYQPSYPQQPPENYQQAPYVPPQSYPQQQPYQQAYPPQQQQQQPWPQQPQQAYPPQPYQQAPMQQVPYQGMPAAYPVPGQPMMMPQQSVMQTNINVNVQKSGPGLFVRALYFFFFGWWAGLVWLNIGFALCAFIITLPIGLMMLNRLPQIMTLKAAGTSTNVNVSTVAVQQAGGNVMVQNINVNVGGTQQVNFLIRALYFVFIGCWVGYLWANLAYACCLTIILFPVGFMMFDRLPAVLTLRKN